jgi:urea transporter
MIICSPISAIFAFGAGIISVCTALMLGVDPHLIYDGHFSESPILTAIGLGGIFFVANSKKHLAFTMIASFFCTII